MSAPTTTLLRLIRVDDDGREFYSTEELTLVDGTHGVYATAEGNGYSIVRRTREKLAAQVARLKAGSKEDESTFLASAAGKKFLQDLASHREKAVGRIAQTVTGDETTELVAWLDATDLKLGTDVTK